MDSDPVYFNQPLWGSYDKLISSNLLNAEKVLIKDKWGNSPLKIRISIVNYSNKINNYIFLTHQDIFLFLLKFKKIESNINTIIKDINSDFNKQVVISIKNKKNFVVTFLNRTEYDGVCVRLVISEKNVDFLDSEKFYLSINEFLSLVVILGQIRNNFLTTSDSMVLFSSVIELNQNMMNIDSKISSYYIEQKEQLKLMLSGSKNLKNDIEQEIPEIDLYGSSDTQIEQLPSDTQIEQLPSDTQIEQLPSDTQIEQLPSSFNETQVHNEMNDYISSSRDDIKIDISDVVEKPPVTVNPELYCFTNDFLSDDLTNLEMYVMNCINDDLPVRKLLELIKEKSNIDFQIPDHLLNSVDYLSTIFIKNSIRNNLEFKKQIPSSVAPIVIDYELDKSQKILSVIFDFYLYCCYYTCVRNILKDKNYNVIANKELFVFSFKSIVSTLIFSFIKDFDKSVLVNEISSRYSKYKNSGVFNSVEDQIKTQNSVNIDISYSSIKEECERIYDVICTHRDSLVLDSSFKNRKSILNFDDFKNNKFTKEQIKKLLTIEFDKRDNKEIKLESYDDLPINILMKYGIEEKKFDTTNLKRYVKEKYKDDEKIQKSSFSLFELMNESYKDLKDVSFDYSLLPEDILKLVLLWDLKKDYKMSTNYLYLLDQVNNSTLTKDMVISMLLNISKAENPEFFNSFLSAKDE